MYFPYLRGKQFELDTLLEVPSSVYQNTLPILEPVTTAQKARYQRLSDRSIPIILLTNPYHPQNNRMQNAEVQRMIDNELSAHTALTLGFIVDQRFDMTHLNSFLLNNPNRNKALVFRFSPSTQQILNIQSAISLYPVDYIIFDERRTNNTVRRAFSTHPAQVLITDGFQKQDRNLDYPASSQFESYYNTWRTVPWYGIGDYLTIGDFFADGGGQGYVVTLHLTIQTPTELEIHHFSSTVHSSTRGLAPVKFREANELLVNSPLTAGLTSQGVEYFRDWSRRAHSAQLGAAKKASMIHHIELMSSIV